MKKYTAVVLLLMLACNKNSNQHAIIVPDVIQAENRRGNITGTIRLFDKDDIPLADASGLTVTIAQTNVSTTTNNQGKWSLDSIPFGTYDLILSKPGFGTSRIMGLYHAANNHSTTNVSGIRNISMISDVQFTEIFTRKASEVYPNFTTMFNLGLVEQGILIYPRFSNNAKKDKPIRFFMSTSPDVSSTNYMVTEKEFYSGSEPLASGNNFKVKWFIANGFEPGQTVYVKAYGDGRYADDYEDPISGLTVFPCLSANGTAVISFVVPLGAK